MKNTKLYLLAVLAIVFSMALPHVVQACGYANGSKVTVMWKGKPYKSTILSCGSTSCKIHYDGWDSKWDENATCDRISGSKAAYSVGEAVQIKWKGKWWPGKIKSLKGALYCIGYDGYGTQWDECVGTDRLKKK